MSLHQLSQVTGRHVGKNNNIIEINGKKYDAKTGAALGHSVNNKHVTHAAKHERPAGVHQSVVKKPSMKDVVRRKPARHAAAHTPKTSHTLMRQVVKKPAVNPKKYTKAVGHTDVLAKAPLAAVVVKPSLKQPDPALLKKAARIPKSKLISHFSPVTSDSGSTFSTVATPTDTPPVQSTPSQAKVTTPATSPTTDLLANALKNARSHEQKHHPKPRKKRSLTRHASAGVSAMLIIAVLGIVGYTEMPDLQMKMASAKAGFSAGLPDYKPSGYSMEELKYSKGIVATKFDSNSDSRAYTLVQKKSSWDSLTLRDLFVEPTDSNYRTVEEAGRTIYLYGSSNATWVSGGIWYQIQSNGALSDVQLIEIASSL